LAAHLPSPACLSVCHREEGANILILARSDARQAESLDEALWRAAAFADAGADLLFIDALASEQEMRAFTGLGGAAAGLPKARALSTLQGIFACVLWHQQMPQDARSFVSCHCSPLPHSRISLQ
jgi:Phosphoenolpyruvate phosphomutase